MRIVYASNGSVLFRDYTTARTREAQKPAVQSRVVALRERDQRLPAPQPDVTAELTKVFERLGMSTGGAVIAAKGRDQ